MHCSDTYFIELMISVQTLTFQIIFLRNYISAPYSAGELASEKVNPGIMFNIVFNMYSVSTFNIANSQHMALLIVNVYSVNI